MYSHGIQLRWYGGDTHIEERDGLHRVGEEAALLAKLPVLSKAERGSQNQEIFLQTQKIHFPPLQIGKEAEEDALVQAQKWPLFHC